jgi:ubiquitin-protein ligase E3 C
MDHWLIKDLDTHGFSSDAVAEEFSLESEPAERRHHISKSRLAVVSPRLGLLNNIPFVIPFEQRVEIFRMFVENDKKRNQVDFFRHSEASKIRRHHMFDDGFNAFQHMGEGFKNRVAITFVDDFGLEEAGIDGGGVFKEFLTG